MAIFKTFLPLNNFLIKFNTFHHFLLLSTLHQPLGVWSTLNKDVVQDCVSHILVKFPCISFLSYGKNGESNLKTNCHAKEGS